MSITPRRQFGDNSEALGAQYLEQKGYVILARNYQKPWGEIDIIAKDGEVIVFAEVKANSKNFGAEFSPEVRVNPKKISNIIKTASLYLEYELRRTDCEWRIDIVSITFHDNMPVIAHFENIAEAYS